MPHLRTRGHKAPNEETFKDQPSFALNWLIGRSERVLVVALGPRAWSTTQEWKRKTLFVLWFQMLWHIIISFTCFVLWFHILWLIIISFTCNSVSSAPSPDQVSFQGVSTYKYGFETPKLEHNAGVQAWDSHTLSYNYFIHMQLSLVSSFSPDQVSFQWVPTYNDSSVMTSFGCINGFEC